LATKKRTAYLTEKAGSKRGKPGSATPTSSPSSCPGGLTPERIIHCREKRSEIWEYAKPGTVHEGETTQPLKFVCGIAGCKFVHPKKGSCVTNSFVAQHLKTVHKISIDISRKTVSAEDQFRLDHSLAIAMVMNHWPLWTPSTPGMRWLASQAHPGWRPCSPETMFNNHLKPMLETLNEKLKQDKTTVYQVFLDGWSCESGVGSTGQRNCIGACITYLDDGFERHTRAIFIRDLEGRHTAGAIRALLIDCLVELGLSPDNMIDIATDNNATECKMVAEVQDSFEELHHTRCFDHTLNLAVRDSLKVR
jgi:hypothetical protein